MEVHRLIHYAFESRSWWAFLTILFLTLIPYSSSSFLYPCLSSCPSPTLSPANFYRLRSFWFHLFQEAFPDHCCFVCLLQAQHVVWSLAHKQSLINICWKNKWIYQRRPMMIPTFLWHYWEVVSFQWCLENFRQEIRLIFLKIFYKFIYLLFLTSLGLCCCSRAFSSCGERGLLFVACWASHCGGFSWCGARALGAGASVVAAHGLSSCGARALEHRLSSCGAWA